MYIYLFVCIYIYIFVYNMLSKKKRRIGNKDGPTDATLIQSISNPPSYIGIYIYIYSGMAKRRRMSKVIDIL